MSELKFEVFQHPGRIDVNFEGLKCQLALKMDEYRSKVFTEDSKKEAKSDLADLRKLKKAVNERRIEVKKIFMQPYNQFEEQVTELQNLIESPISYIDGQVKEFEEKRVQEKKSEIEKAYKEIIPEELCDYIPLECIYNPKWTNVATSIKSIRHELTDIASKTKNDIDTISAMNSDKNKEALNLYMSNRDLACAMKYIADYENRKAEIIKKQETENAERIEREREAERERIRREERERIVEEERIRHEAKKEAVDEIKKIEESEAAPLSSKQSQRVIYTVVATPEEQEEIEIALTSLGVYFERKNV